MARRLPYLANEHLRVIRTDLSDTRNALAGRHEPHPGRSICAGKSPPQNSSAPPCAPARPRRVRYRLRHPRWPPDCAADSHLAQGHHARPRKLRAPRLLRRRPRRRTPRHLDQLPVPADANNNLADRIWDLDLVADLLAEHPLQQAAVLSRPDGAQLVVLDQHDERNGFLIAAVAPSALPDEAYRAVPEPNGIALTDDPFLSAEQVAADLLPRYDTALAQVRHNALGGIQHSQADRVVLTWQPDGSVATAPVDGRAGAVLISNGFVQDPQSGIYSLNSNDTQAQARALRGIGPQLEAIGIGTALQHPAGRAAPTSAPAAAPPVPAGTRAPAARGR